MEMLGLLSHLRPNSTVNRARAYKRACMRFGWLFFQQNVYSTIVIEGELDDLDKKVLSANRHYNTI